MADIQTSEVDAKLDSINVGSWILYADRSWKDEQLLLRPLLFKKNINVEDS
jgi:hypothetical protein